MTIGERVMAALQNAGLPVYFDDWHPAKSGDAPPAVYLTYATASRPNEHADDKRTGWEHFVYLDLWSKGGNQTQKALVMTAMETAGFDIEDARDSHEGKTDTRQCAMTWVYQETVSAAAEEALSDAD